MAAKTETLHLDEKQLVEFEKMAPAQARLLRLWREATPGPWRMMGHVFIDVIHDVPMATILIEMARGDCSSDRKAIVHTRNSAELNAAWLYWEMKRLRNQVERMEGPQTLRVGSREYDERMDQLGDEMLECEDKLAAISAALEEIR